MIQSIDRAMGIIDAMASDPERPKWLAAEIADATELPISTVYRLLQSLEAHSLVSQDVQTKQYELGFKWVEVGLRKYEKLDVRVVARPVMEELAADVRETVYLNTPNDDVSIIVDRIDSPRSVRIIDAIGERIPMHIGAANKVMLANMPRETAARLLDRRVKDTAERTELESQLRLIRRKDFAISRGEKTPGTLAVAAPVFDFEGRVLAAISVEAIESQVTDDQVDRFIEKVVEAAERISGEMGRRG
ncbi:IclR family transcriptional regulator [Edaphobacillus lindanitolerans]|uniref:Transcriptional regulator, IclR family n=1 Tax=Edaphobacillus lindanitolerans TaxID=550447 RepID=A0A1U7PNW5_9BACI|nr:IclR family transcriptional regulator [Edaphobacillus lindanitolerans]SIT74071.1 transcriptional regulator, IclR family [Edaphobacillus lindanitolerans]